VRQHTTPGQRADCTEFEKVIDGIRIRRSGRGRPRTRPGRVLADKAYSAKRIRGYLRGRGIRATIPEKDDQAAARRRRGRHSGRPPAFDTEAYKDRNTAQRCFNKLKQSRAVATRFDKRDYIYNGTIELASIRIWLRDLAQ
jgi:transposase